MLRVLSSKRIEWIDFAKGVGVYLVAVGHLWYACPLPIVNKVIYSFHMPMFFMLSGYVTRWKDVAPKDYVLGKVLRLLVPAVLFILMGVPFYLHFSHDMTLKELVKRIIFWNGLCPFNAPAWYFIVLFEVSVFNQLLRLSKLPISAKSIAAAAFFVLGWLVFSSPIQLHFGFDRAIVALGFHLIGQAVGDASRIVSIEETTKRRLLRAFLPIAALLCAAIGGICNGKVSFYAFDLQDYWLFIAAGLVGSLAFFAGSFLIWERLPRVRAWAEPTILFVGTHYLIVQPLVILMNRVGFSGGLASLVIALLLPLALLEAYKAFFPVIDRRLPALTGSLTWRKSR